MNIPRLTEKQKKSCDTFVTELEKGIGGGSDVRGLMLLYVAEELKKRDQHYTASLLFNAAFVYGY
jgi:hypothetical protein